MYSHLPLEKRVLRTHLKPLSILPPTGSRGAYRGWEEVNLVNAMLAIDKGVSLRRAAEMYKIPWSTSGLGFPPSLPPSIHVHRHQDMSMYS